MRRARSARPEAAKRPNVLNKIKKRARSARPEAAKRPNAPQKIKKRARSARPEAAKRPNVPQKIKKRARSARPETAKRPNVPHKIKKQARSVRPEAAKRPNVLNKIKNQARSARLRPRSGMIFKSLATRRSRVPEREALSPQYQKLPQHQKPTVHLVSIILIIKGGFVFKNKICLTSAGRASQFRPCGQLFEAHPGKL
ncbi:hypothetical protein niasHS_017261 [Heterodera schachtii]|uniref:Uncharacterized protein n=1 Tax=Heterodera schachtii TaxID=97005 RepID=A0ABD2HZD6_HETSC